MERNKNGERIEWPFGEESTSYNWDAFQEARKRRCEVAEIVNRYGGPTPDGQALIDRMGITVEHYAGKIYGNSDTPES